MKIRPYEERDAAAVRACFVALQDHEHDMIPLAPRGEPIADGYLAWMFGRLEAHEGALLVAEVDDEVVAFVGVLGRVPRESLDDGDDAHAFIGEVSVMPGHRGRGIGKALIDAAIAHARGCGASNIRLAVVSENEGARRLYESLGFRSAFEVMILRL